MFLVLGSAPLLGSLSRSARDRATFLFRLEAVRMTEFVPDYLLPRLALKLMSCLPTPTTAGLSRLGWGRGSVHEGLHLLECEAAIFVRIHGLENALVSGLKLLQGDRTISIRID
jgi:hypothetical protein